jgi:hypothetical protein
MVFRVKVWTNTFGVLDALGLMSLRLGFDL